MECNEWNDLNGMEWNGMYWYAWMDERMDGWMDGWMDG